MKRQLGVLACLALLSSSLAGQTPQRPPLVEGQPVETRPTERKDNAPTFPEQTRAPYRKTAPYKVTTLIDNLEAPWGLAFLPAGKILVRMPSD